MAETLAMKAASLFSEGATYREVGKALEISMARVGKLVREGYLSVLKNRNGNPDADTISQAETELGDKPGYEVLDPPIIDVEEDYDYEGILEKTFLVKATPILRKVALNPRIFFYFDYAQKRFGWEGDIGDFLIECVEYFWKSKGYSIRVTYDEEI